MKCCSFLGRAPILAYRPHNEACGDQPFLIWFRLVFIGSTSQYLWSCRGPSIVVQISIRVFISQLLQRFNDRARLVPLLAPTSPVISPEVVFFAFPCFFFLMVNLHSVLRSGHRVPCVWCPWLPSAPGGHSWRTRFFSARVPVTGLACWHPLCCPLPFWVPTPHLVIAAVPLCLSPVDAVIEGIFWPYLGLGLPFQCFSPCLTCCCMQFSRIHCL